MAKPSGRTAFRDDVERIPPLKVRSELGVSPSEQPEPVRNPLVIPGNSATEIPQVNTDTKKKVRPQSKKPQLSWNKGNVIGSGGFGVVYLGMDRNTGRLIAGKEFNFDVKEQRQRELLEQLHGCTAMLKSRMIF